MSETTLPDLGSAKVRIIADKSSLSSGLKDGEAETKKAVVKIQASLNGLGKVLSAGITAPILALGTAAAASMESLNRAMITLRAGTGSVGVAMRGLHDDFLAVLHNADEPVQIIAQDMALLNQRTGMTGEGLQTLTEQFQILQKYTGEKPIREITRVFGDWSVASKDQVAVLDELYRAYQRTGVSLTELATNVVQYGAPMRVLGFSLHETIALFAKWNMEGVNTVNVMGGLRMMLAKFNAGGVKDAKAAFEGLAEAIRGAKDFVGGVNIANALMGGDKSGAFGVRNTNDTVAAIREGRFELAGLVNDLVNGQETLSGIDAEGNTLADTFGRFKNQLTAAFDPLTKQYQDGLRQFGDTLSGVAASVEGLVRAFAALPPETQEMIVGIAAITAAVGPALVSISALIAAFGLIAPSLPAAAVVVAAIGAITLVVVDAINIWRDFGPVVSGAMSDMSNAVKSTTADITNLLGTMADSVGFLGDGWGATFLKMADAFGAFVSFVVDKVSWLYGPIALIRGVAGMVGMLPSGKGGEAGGGLYDDELLSAYEDAVFGGTAGANRAQGITPENPLAAAKREAGDLAELLGKAGKAALTLDDALTMRQGARPLEAMTAELRKVMEMAAKFPTVIDPETIALLTGQAFEGGGGKIPFAAAYDALMLLNPAMGETIMQYKAMDEAQKMFQAGAELGEEIARAEAEAMRHVFDGLDVVVEKTKKEMTALQKVQFGGRMSEALGSLGGQIERVTGKSGALAAAMKIVGAVGTAAANAVTAFAEGCAAGGPLVGVLNAALSVLLDLFGLMPSATEKVKTGWDRAAEEIGKKWNDWADRMTDTLVEFVETGKFAFDDLVKSIAEDLMKIGLKWMVIQPMLHFLGVPNSAFAAKGLVNDGGSVAKFAQGGGVVTRPMRFNMGMGLIGEGAKPAEAYVPLTRTRSGDLGVSVEGVASGAKVNVTVNNFGPTPVTKTESLDADGTRTIQLTIEGIVKRGMARGAFDAVAGSAWGLTRRGASYG